MIMHWLFVLGFLFAALLNAVKCIIFSQMKSTGIMCSSPPTDNGKHQFLFSLRSIKADSKRKLKTILNFSPPNIITECQQINVQEARVDPRSFLPCFSKGSESKFHAFCSSNEQINFETENKEIVGRLAQKSQALPKEFCEIMQARPKSNFCQICKETFSDYLKHLQHPVHIRKFENQAKNKLIDDLLKGLDNQLLSVRRGRCDLVEDEEFSSLPCKIRVQLKGFIQDIITRYSDFFAGQFELSFKILGYKYEGKLIQIPKLSPSFTHLVPYSILWAFPFLSFYFHIYGRAVWHMIQNMFGFAMSLCWWVDHKIFCFGMLKSARLDSFLQQNRMAKQAGYDEAIAISIIALNSLSLVSLILILAVYIINWKAISSFSMRLCFYLCLSCLGQSATAVILNPILTYNIETTSSDATSFCIFEGVLKTTFDLSSIIWTTLILYSVYASIHTGKPIQKLEIVYLFIGFALPIVSACIPIFFDLYGYNQYFCWFISDFTSTGFFLRLGYYFMPLWILFIANMIFAGLTYKKLKEIQVPQNQLSVFKKILIFPLILLVTGLVATINTFHNYFSQNEIVWLHWTGMILQSLYGFFTSIAYGFNPVIIQRIKLCCLPDNHVSSRESLDSNLYRSYRSRLTTSGFNEMQAIQLSSKFSNSKSSAMEE